MNKNYKNYRNSNTFGGELFLSDFSTYHPSPISWASRIMADKKFDEDCKRIYERKLNNNNKEN